MKINKATRYLVLAAIFASLSFTISKLDILAVPTPIPPIQFDLRGVFTFIGAMLVPYYYAWFIGWAASGFDLVLEFGIDFTGWIPATLVCSFLYGYFRKRFHSHSILNSSVSVLLGQLTGNLSFILPFMFVYGVPFSQAGNTALVLFVRSILNFIIIAPIMYYIERRARFFLRFFDVQKKEIHT
jgi:uncharacterized membrane protein